MNPFYYYPYLDCIPSDLVLLTFLSSKITYFPIGKNRYKRFQFVDKRGSI